jgi:hypothetical protein
MPRGVAKALTDNPIRCRCWCGKSFEKKAENHLHCSKWCKNKASLARSLMPTMPPPASPPQRKKEKLALEPLESKIVFQGD